MRSNLLTLTVSLTIYFLLVYGNKTETENSYWSEVPVSLGDEVYKKNLTTDEEASINTTSILQSEEKSQYGKNISEDTNTYNNLKIYDHNEILATEDKWTLEESVTVPEDTFLGNIDDIIYPSNNRSEFAQIENDIKISNQTDFDSNPYVESTAFGDNATSSKHESMSYEIRNNDYDIENDDGPDTLDFMHNGNGVANFKDKEVTSTDEDSDMEFENIFDEFIEDGDNLNNITSHARNFQANWIDLSQLLDDSDVLRNYELGYEKYKSPGIESASLVVEGKMSTKVVPNAPINRNPYNNLRTTKILTSNVEVNEEHFFISRSDSGKQSQLELQDDWKSNISTHEDAVSRLAIDKTIYVLPSLIVELAEGNSLWLNPNIRQDFYYEVTNNLNSAVQIRFKVTDEKSILWSMDKYNVYLSPHDTTRVRLTVIPRIDVDTDRIIFNAIGAETVHKEAIVHVNKNIRTDDSYPLVDYSYTSDCTDVGLADCHKGTWTIKVSARDRESGLMLLTTIPKGIYFPDGYTAGTTEEVTGYFSDTCCNADLQIIAVDSLNNRIVKQANAYSAPLSFWAIIAIVLACLVILVIIIAIVIYCVKKYKERQAGSFDLPTYRGRYRY